MFKIGTFFILSVLVASFGSGFQHGYNTAVLNTPQDIIEGWMEQQLNMSKNGATFLWSIIVSIFCIGGMIGGTGISFIANFCGRKGGLIMNNVLVLTAAFFLGFAKKFGVVYFLIIGRFIIGICAGLGAGLAPLYLNEISPTRFRGAVGSMYQLNITISILLAQLFGIESLLGNERLWPFLLALIALIGILQAVGLSACPESPKYYLERKNDEYNARKALEMLSGGDVTAQFMEIKNDIEDAKALPKVTIAEMLKTKKLRTPLFIICFLMMAQQLSGINAVIFYSTQIFKMGNLSSELAKWSTVGTGLVNALITVVSVFLVERFGRKPLLLIGFAGMAVASIFLLISLYFVANYTFASYLSIILVYLFITFFSVGVGSIPWLLGPELFNTASRPMAVSIAVPVNWAFNFIVGIIFLPLQEILGPAVFLIFIICQLVTFIFIWLYVPETKNRPIEEITALFD